MLRRHRHRISIITAGAIAVSCLISIAAKKPDPDEARAEQIREYLMSNAVEGTSDIADLYAWEWISFLPLSLPYDDSFLNVLSSPAPLILPASSRRQEEAYSKEFLDGLVPVVKEGITFFPVQMLLDSNRREINIYNAEESLISTIPIDPDFLPVEWAERCFGSAVTRSADRMQLYVDFILEGDIDLYIALQELKAESAQTEAEAMLPGPMKAYSGPPVTNIQFTAVEKVSNGVMVTIAYPSGYTNQLELFKCEDLVEFWWESYGVSNINTSTNWIEWTDTGATNGTDSKCFYAAGNADLDTDGDSLTDAREKYMYHSSPTTNNTDGDAFSDYDEVMTYNTDPSNSDTTPPTILSFFPTNNHQQVWMP